MKEILPQRLILSEIQEALWQLLSIEPDLILRRTRMSAVFEARALFCYIAVRLSIIKGTEVRRFLAIGPSGWSKQGRHERRIDTARQSSI